MSRAIVLLVFLMALERARPVKRAGSAPAGDDRVESLLRRMTVEEKVGQLNQYSAGEPTGPGTGRTAYETMIAAGQVGSLLNVPTAAQVNALQQIAVEQSRLRIPLLFAFDVIHGFRTVFPVNLGLAASWDLELIEKTARLAAQEAYAQGIRWTFSPMVDIARDARWGRIAEGAGEDPLLGAAIAAAYVRGYQGERLDRPGAIAACAKHLAGYGAAEAGRDYNTTEISERSLRQVYLPPFRAAVDAGVATIMAAFNAIDGVPASANAWLLGSVLRDEWGFRGLVVSDWNAVAELIPHGIANDAATAASKAFLAGVDMDMESGAYHAELADLVREGRVPSSALDEAVRRVLRLKVALGLFERPYAEGDPGLAPLPPSARALARAAAEASFVLLQNDPVQGRPLLPLACRRGQTVALLGPLADSAADMLGPWSGRGLANDVTTLRAALAQRATAAGMTLLYERGIDLDGSTTAGIEHAVAVARSADVVLLALGERGEWTGEAASRAYLDLGAAQQRLLEALVATGKPLVLILFNGRPLTIPWAARHVPAIVEAWFPGIEAGPALTRVLCGDVSPSGHLTASFPRTVGQEPLYYDALPTGRPLPAPKLGPDGAPLPITRYVSRYIDELNRPLFPFGHGLSYTTFGYSPVAVSADELSAAAVARGETELGVASTVTNTGTRAATTVVQCYIRQRGTSVARPVRELAGFRRLALAPGQSERVAFRLGKRELAFWNLAMEHTVEPAQLEVWIAPDATTGTPATVRITK